MSEDRALALIDRLEAERSLSEAEYGELLSLRTDAVADYAAAKARAACERVYGDGVFVRGLIEISSVCKNDCLYCGLRASNARCERYRLTDEQILDCCREGHALGFRTFVLQGGEDPARTVPRICALVKRVKADFPDCAVTLSLGEYPYEDYRAMREAGADRYLLRHETADPAHYARLHPQRMSFENRMRCLYDLKALGYQVGCGFMVGSPWQNGAHLAKDLKFIEEFSPHMCGIGPFIPHRDTPFASFPAGTLEATTFLLSLLRLMKPNLLLPATTALGTIDPRGREKGILAGANVVMPNLSPVDVRGKYSLYDGKICTGEEAAECHTCLEARIARIGYQAVSARGDHADWVRK